MKGPSYAEQFLGKELRDIDPAIAELVELEEERQARKIILIPSESVCPKPIRDALGSVFSNLYAEGYPPRMMCEDDEDALMDFDWQLVRYRRYGDRRFYKGCDYVHILETLAQRRAARLFATEEIPADSLYVNVQPLSGAAANNAVYEAFLQPGDGIMGMNLSHGGHLTHGSIFSRSGKRFRPVPYEVDPVTQRLDYDRMKEIAREHRPKIVVAGFTSYPWAPDWKRLREVADQAGAILMADIAHPAGLVAAGLYPNPVGVADVITMTTHKTLFGPRGAIILTADPEMAAAIDASVFPGEQGGPHVNKFAAMAVAFKIARTEAFRRLQQRILDNARHLAAALSSRGLNLFSGGTDTHLLLVDLRNAGRPTGFPLKGEIAARILDLAGIVVNKNTIPGDETAADASAIRLGTPWVSQYGMGKEEMEAIADMIVRILEAIHPFFYYGLQARLPRGKIDIHTLEKVKGEVEELLAACPKEARSRGRGYPHYHRLRASGRLKASLFCKESAPMNKERLEEAMRHALLVDLTAMGVIEVTGERALPFVQGVCTKDVARIRPGQAACAMLMNQNGSVIDRVLVIRPKHDTGSRSRFLILTYPGKTEEVLAWFRGLSEGYTLFDEEDLFAKIEGPVIVRDLNHTELAPELQMKAVSIRGQKARPLLERIAPVKDKKEPRRAGRIIIAELAGDPNGYIIIGASQDIRRIWDELSGENAGIELYRAGIETECFLDNRAEPKESSRSEEETPLEVSEEDIDLQKPFFIGRKRFSRSRPADQAEGPSFSRRQEEHEAKESPLRREHERLGAKIAQFAGWNMPLWYRSTVLEHRAVRERAALFDVSHMGIIEISGPDALQFIDMVTTNYARWIKDGQSQYTFILDPRGRLIDDAMLYRIDSQRFMMVVNAVNTEKVLTWLQRIKNKEVLIDRSFPEKQIDGQYTIRDLKAASSGDSARVDLALQGPLSLDLLKELVPDSRTRFELGCLKKNHFIETTLAGIETLVSRTGYTGERIGYELFVHPEEAPRMWNLLLERGEASGIIPAGLAARDSTRIEAGLPLYGHELEGPFGIDPVEAGFGYFVKPHKPFFVGREEILKAYIAPRRHVVRFQMCKKGIRMFKQGDPVVELKGERCIGWVTSCAVNPDGFQIGMAIVETEHSREGTRIGLVHKAALSKGKETSRPLGLGVGDILPLHQEGVILSRFPEWRVESICSRV